MSHIFPDNPPTLDHAHSLAGLDLFAAGLPAVRVEAARHVVVVVSRSRDPEREIDLARCHQDGVPVIVRPSGGGAVVLAPGVVTASAVAPAGGARFPEDHFHRFNGVVVRALSTIGVTDLERRGISDLCVGDRKVAGSALRLFGDQVLFQLSLLVSPDLSLLDRYLRHPSREPAYRRGRTHRDFVVSLASAGYAVNLPLLLRVLENALCSELIPRKPGP